jgi:hypothetical protein
MTCNSSLYVGSVMHRRLKPRVHQFRYRAFWLLIDLDELTSLSGELRWFSHNRANLFSLRDADHGDGGARPLRAQAEAKLREAGVTLAGGTIRLLCMPRMLGYCFNPLSVYFCSHADGTPAALIYQVHNTFGERLSYVIPVRDGGGLRQHCRKALYVSPFLPMDMRYDFRVHGPDERLAVGIRASTSEGPILNAVMAGERQDLTDRNLLRVFFAIPAITLKVMAAIHWEALRLWLKGVRLQPRPVRTQHGAATIAAPSLEFNRNVH